jgi:hypothetical protein
MSETKSQSQLILAHLQSGGTLTVFEAMFEPFRCMALSQRCGNLKQDGWNIKSEMVKLPSGKRVARYSIPADKQRLDAVQ